MVVGVGGSVLMGAVLYGQQMWNYWKPRRAGVYGPTLVGKTTLDQFMTTPGEMGEVYDSTLHSPRLIGKGHVLPRATRKRVIWSGEKRVLHTADIGGQQRFWNLWVDDLVDRQVEYVIFMTDHRVLNRVKGVSNSDKIDTVGGFDFLADCLIEKRWTYRRLLTRLKGKRYAPKMVMLVANKADVWWDDTANLLWQAQRLREHPIFDAHRPAMRKLQKAGIPCRVSMMATNIGWNVEKTIIDMLGY
jgi:hypothetical protein